MRMFDQVGGGFRDHQRQRARLRLGQPHTEAIWRAVRRAAATWLVSVMGTQDIGMAGGSFRGG